MDDFDDEIPEIEFEYNFSVIYKGKEEREGKILQPIEEFKTSKDEFFRKLRYFKKKSHEFDHIDEIFIHEDFPVEIFRIFIDSIKTNKIHLSDDNYLPLSQLSSKYEYIELRQKVETFITRGMEILFDFTGKVQSVVLEPGTYKLEVWGAEGGKHGNRTNTPGKGGYSSGILKLESKTKLFIHVGESPTSKNGGWNGGGSGHETCAAGGGGATDISLYGSDGSSDWNNKDHLYSRIIVAGGGGGSAHNSYSVFYGGFGGGLSGQNSGTCCGLGGKQTCAGESHIFTEYQGFGIGGNHKKSCSSGGGGGWYGGSSSNADNGHHAGGSGGSGYVYTQSTAANYPSGCLLNSSFYLSNASTVAGNSSFPSPSNSGNEVGHCGNGYAKISIK